jgi:NTE family protein
LNQADLIVGTSAGAMIGTAIRSGASADDIYARATVAPPGAAALFSNESPETLLSFFENPDAGSASTRERLGAQALTDYTIPEDRWMQIVALANGAPGAWPALPLKIAAIDAIDGSVALFDPSGRATLSQAIAASTAVPGLVQPVAVGGQRYMDGGVAGTNIDAATGYDVIAIIPYSAPSTELEIARVEAAGGRVLLIEPDAFLGLPFDLDAISSAGAREWIWAIVSLRRCPAFGTWQRVVGRQ